MDCEVEQTLLLQPGGRELSQHPIIENNGLFLNASGLAIELLG